MEEGAECAKAWEGLGKAWCYSQPVSGWCFVLLLVFGSAAAPAKHDLSIAHESSPGTAEF